MRFARRGIVAAIAALLLTTPSFAQKSAEVRYFTGLGDLLGDRATDSFLRETRQGGKIVSALLDVCYAVALHADRKDRFAIELKADGNKLTGAGQSTEDRTPITIEMMRKPAGKAFVFEGKIALGNESFKFKSEDNTDIGDKEFEETQASDDDIVTAPANFTEVSPSSLGIRIKRQALPAVVNSLRGENAQVALDSLNTDCAALRSGEQVLRLNVDPARAQATLDKMKALPDVKSVGWTSGIYDMERAVRFPAASWQENGKLARDKIASVLSDAVGKALGATPQAAKWSNITGEATLSLKRPSSLAPALKLTETLEFVTLIGPDKPGTTDRLVIWLGIPTSITRDEQAGPRLEISPSASGEDEGTFNDDDGAVKAIAAALNGQRWDTKKSQWK